MSLIWGPHIKDLGRYWETRRILGLAWKVGSNSMASDC